MATPVTMATPISSHVKDKNSMFTARDEDMIFSKRKKSWYFTGVYIINRGYYTVPRRYEFYVREARTISHLFASLTREIFIVLATRT